MCASQCRASPNEARHWKREPPCATFKSTKLKERRKSSQNCFGAHEHLKDENFVHIYLICGDRWLINASFIRHVTQKSLPLIEQIRMRATPTEKFKFIVPFR